MASFRCLLTLAGQEYPVVQCAYEFGQEINERGRVATKVRSGLLTLEVDVPDGDQLLAWATDPHQKLSGTVVFEAIDGPVAHEQLDFTDGLCVAYEETFRSGATPEGAYRCHLQVAAAKLAVGTVAKDNVWAQSR